MINLTFELKDNIVATITSYTRPTLGTGIYTIPDISLILNLPPSKVRRWIIDFWDDRLALNSGHTYSYGVGRERVVSFHLLIEFFTFFQLRKYGVSAKKILDAHRFLSDFLRSPYPFANANILTEGNKVLFSPDLITIINADSGLQLYLTEIIEPFCKKVEFNSSNLAKRFWPNGRQSSIVVDPDHQFGQPVINGTNILAETLKSMYTAGENIKFIAELYEINESQVQDALNFCKIAA